MRDLCARDGPVRLHVGPFLDTGKITDPSANLGSHEWLCNTGAQAKHRVFDTGIGFSYGKDLRSGNNAFYLTLLRLVRLGWRGFRSDGQMES